MRSVLLTAASNTAIRRSRGSSSTTIPTTSTASSTSIQAWTMPSPNGPSRSTVGGTMPQPLASRDEERRDLAPGQRPVREVVERPLADGRLVDGLNRRGGSGGGQIRVTRASIALFVDPMSRPTISISPSRSTSSALAPSITARTRLRSSRLGGAGKAPASTGASAPPGA